MTLRESRTSPRISRVVTYARIVVDYRPQKADPNRVSITGRRNLIQYPGELTALVLRLYIYSHYVTIM